MGKPSPHFFNRSDDGSVRLRMRFTPEEADMIEEAAGSTPLVAYLHSVINEAVERDAQEAKFKRMRRMLSNIDSS